MVAPPNVGTPFVTYEIRLCLAAPPKTCIPTKTCTANATATASTTCIIAFSNHCEAPDTDCLWGNTNYTAVAVGDRSDGIKSLDSNIPTFATKDHE